MLTREPENTYVIFFTRPPYLINVFLLRCITEVSNVVPKNDFPNMVTNMLLPQISWTGGPTGVDVVFFIGSVTIATVNSTGLVEGVVPGNTTVTGRAQERDLDTNDVIVYSEVCFNCLVQYCSVSITTGQYSSPGGTTNRDQDMASLCTTVGGHYGRCYIPNMVMSCYTVEPVLTVT